ncbi:hypothetical protein ACX9NE_06020 [Mycobacterium sp. ML4]
MSGTAFDALTGLLLDTPTVRTLAMPSIATLLGAVVPVAAKSASARLR